MAGDPFGAGCSRGDLQVGYLQGRADGRISLQRLAEDKTSMLRHIPGETVAARLPMCVSQLALIGGIEQLTTTAQQFAIGGLLSQRVFGLTLSPRVKVAVCQQESRSAGEKGGRERSDTPAIPATDVCSV